MRRISILIVAAGLLAAGCAANLETPPPTAETVKTAVPSHTKKPAAAQATAPGEWPDAFAMNRRIGRGINFGNALEAPDEGEWGIVLREEYFQLAKDAGFSAIRLPVRWNTHALEAPPFTVFSSFFDRVDWAVDNALSRGMVLILDFHHFTDYMDCPACERERFLRLWEQIADHYQDYPPELVFELLNEPTNAVPSAVWDADLASALGIIRAGNPDRIVVVGPVGWNGLGGLDYLHLPEEDRGLIVTFHYYEPFPFTHQGADWMAGADAWLGTEWTGTAEEMRAVREDFMTAYEWGQTRNRPIFLGEFGSIERADISSRARYTAFVAREAEALSFSWAYWEFCSGFGVYDPAAGAWRDPLLGALLPGK
jgi:endoglucanase